LDPGNSTIEVFCDDRWHYLDVFLKCYFWTKDKSHLANQEEIAADPSIVLNAVKEGRAARQHLCCGDVRPCSPQRFSRRRGERHKHHAATKQHFYHRLFHHFKLWR